MATQMAYAPFTPFGHDGGLSVDSPFPFIENHFPDMNWEMFPGNAESFEEEMMDLMNVDSAVESSAVQAQSYPLTGGSAAASDSLTVYAGHTAASHQLNNQSTTRATVESVSGGSTRSPGTTSLILTPASTLLDYNASLSDSNLLEEEESDDNISPTSDNDYVHVSRSQVLPRTYRPGPQNSYMSNSQRHASSSQVSGGSDAQHLSRASSLAPSTASLPGAQWGNVYAHSGTFADTQHVQHSSSDNTGLYVASTYPPGTNAYTSSDQNYSDALSDNTSFDPQMFGSAVHYRPGQEQHVYGQNIYGSSSTLTPGYHPAYLRMYGQFNPQPQQPLQHVHQFGQQSSMRHAPGSSFPPALSIPSTNSLLVQPQTNRVTAPPKMEHMRSSPSPMQNAPHGARKSAAVVPSHHNPTYPQTGSRLEPQNSAMLQANANRQPTVALRQPVHPGSASNRPLQAAKARPSMVPSNAPRASAIEQGRKGGRQKGVQLAEQAKLKSSRMRKAVACWRCALQRDPCDPGMPCNRCLMRAQKGQQYFFDCDRSKLPDFVHDFLPATMTLMHQKQTIEDTVADQVLEWDKAHSITVYLTSGYGPPLRWELHEFKPRTQDLLGQFQYFQNPETGRQERQHKYSPPFGLLKLDASDDAYLETYLESLLDSEWLWDLGWTCFEEESLVDDNHFQARLLEQMCTLFEHTTDTELKALLREILRMMVITYIMGHTLTIVQDTLVSVLDAVKFSPTAHARRQPFTSPRLANRQLKFYFSVLRSQIYEKILKWQQQTLHTSGKKEDSWLLSFCAMIGFAMVLEEVQRTILIQADAKATKQEMTPEQANTEASNACERIDARFKLLVGLFQCKYRDKKWTDNGSFGPATPRFDDPVINNFLHSVRELVETRKGHLEARKNIQFGFDNQCQYTSRLVARFLLPFLDLPS